MRGEKFAAAAARARGESNSSSGSSTAGRSVARRRPGELVGNGRRNESSSKHLSEISVLPDDDDDEYALEGHFLGEGLGHGLAGQFSIAQGEGQNKVAAFPHAKALFEVRDEESDSDESDGFETIGGRKVAGTGQPLRLMRNVSGYDVREDRLDVRCDSLVTGSEPHFFRLMAASVSGNVVLARKMLEKMSMIEIAQLNPVKDSPTYGLNPLHVASSVEVVKTLLHNGINIDIEGLNGQTPLHTHTHNNRTAIIKYLVDHGAKVDSQTKFNGSTPLQWAVAADNLKVAKILVNAGANVIYKNYSGNTALHMVQSVPVAKFLVEHGAKLDVANDEGRLPLEEAANRAVDESQLDVALFLLDLSRRTYFSRSGTADEDEDGSSEAVNDESGFEEFETYQTSKQQQQQQQLGQTVSTTKIAKKAISSFSVHSRARQRWQTIKSAFITGETVREDDKDDATDSNGAHEHLSSRASSIRSFANRNDFSGEEFYSTFFEVMVKERPALALKVLDKQRTFLYWENDSRIYSYNTSLLGTIPNSSFAVKQMVFYDQAELIAHPVVQYVLNLRWVLFTREILFFEFVVHLLFVALLLLTTLSVPSYIDLSVLSTSTGLFAEPTAEKWWRLAILLANILLAHINIRYIKIQIVQAKLQGLLAGTGNSWSRIIHCRLRNEPYYLVPHIFILISQILRCIPESPTCYVVADVLVSVISPQLFYRGLSFGEGFRSIGVPMCTIRSMISSNLIYFFLVFVLITGFSHSIRLLYRNVEDSDQYGSFTMSWITLFFFAFNLDVSSLNEEKVPHRKYFSFFMVGIYMFIVSLVTFQLICAVMTNKYEEIYANSKEQYLLQKARLILFYEQYEMAQTSMMYSITNELVESGGEFQPSGDSRHFVKELVDGTVLLEVPRHYIDQCTSFRKSHDKYFHIFRYWLFKRWKTLRRSRSFLYPEANPTPRTNGGRNNQHSQNQTVRNYGTVHADPGWVPPHSLHASYSHITEGEEDEGSDNDIEENIDVKEVDEDSSLLESAAQVLQDKGELVLIGSFHYLEEISSRKQLDDLNEPPLLASSDLNGKLRGTSSIVLGLSSSPSLSRPSPSMMLSPNTQQFGRQPSLHHARNVSFQRTTSTQPRQNGGDSCKHCKQVIQALQAITTTQQEMMKELSHLRAQIAAQTQSE